MNKSILTQEVNFENGALIVKKTGIDKRIHKVMKMHGAKVQIASLEKDRQPDQKSIRAPYAELFRLANQHERLCGFRIDDLISHLGLKGARDILNGSKDSDVCKATLKVQFDAWHAAQELSAHEDAGFKEA